MLGRGEGLDATTSRTSSQPAESIPRRFPFRADGPEDEARANAAMGAEISAVDDMLYRLAFRYAKGDRHTIEEMAADAAIYLWQRCLPRFDTRNGAKVSTFLFVCAKNRMRDIARSRLRQRRNAKLHQEGAASKLPTANDRCDRQVERIAKDVIANPEKYLTPQQCRIFRAMQTMPPETPKQEIAKKLGYANAGYLSTMVGRMRDAIRKIDIEDWEGD